jgi:hypothetical protein
MGTYGCKPYLLSLGPSGTDLEIKPLGLNEPLDFTIFWMHPNAPVSGTWTEQDPQSKTEFRIAPRDTTHAWLASSHEIGYPDQGSSSVTMSNVAPLASTFYKANGTMTATLIAEPGSDASGTVTVAVTF